MPIVSTLFRHRRRAFLVAAVAGGVALVAGASGGPSLSGDVARTTRAVLPAGGGALSAHRPACDPDNGGLQLPDGFCAVAVVRDAGPVRHLVVAPNGDVFANVSQRHVLALRDTSGDGRADVTRTFGSGGTGIALTDKFLYYATDAAVYRYAWRPGQLEPTGPADTIVRDLPATRNHTAKSLALGRADTLFVNIGSPSNSCQARDREARSPGQNPCPELATRAGIWAFSATRLGQRQADGVRYATGLRNTLALATHPRTGALFGAIHGRDQLAQNWGFSAEKSAENPGEELVRIERGDDFGWPYCYYDVDRRAKVLAPEYGGDGTAVGRCARAKAPPLVFPGHWAPMAMVFTDGTPVGPGYESGAFIAFHGSWNRAPLPQAGYRVVWVPFRDGQPAGGYSTFATGVGGPTALRASGLALGPDGSLYIADDRAGTIWRVMHAARAERAAAGAS